MNRLLAFLTLCNCVTSCAQTERFNFDIINKSSQWNLVFEDYGTSDWTEKWALDGLIATVENSKNGMHFKAGLEAGNDAHHAVLWTKESFSGDVKIEFDYIKTDDANKYVNILYIQATGDEEGVYEKDIANWKHLRKVPKMRMYFENMNTFHISFSAFGNDGAGLHYVRARRYPKPDNKPFNSIVVEPSYDMQGLFEKRITYHITAIKTKTHLFFKMESKNGVEVFEWNISNIPPIGEGRVGLRQMYTRSSIYKNFKIYSK